MRWREAAEDLWDNLPGERLRHRRVLLVGQAAFKSVFPGALSCSFSRQAFPALFVA